MADTLDMTGDWKLTYGLEIGFTIDSSPAHHLVPKQPTPTLLVHFDRDLVTPATPGLPAFHAAPGVDETPATPNGIRYKGFYRKTNPPHRPNSEQPGALMAEAWYAGRGVYVVTIIDRVELYIAVLSGNHQFYKDDPTRIEIVGGWTDVGDAVPPVNTNSNRGSFSLVKVS